MGIDSPSEQKSTSDKLLQKLHEKAKAREKQRAQDNFETPSPAPKKELWGSHARKLNRREERQHISYTKKDSTKNDGTQLVHQDKNLNKRKVLHVDIDNSGEEETQISSSVKTKKKKKHQTHENDSDSQDIKRTKHKHVETGNSSEGYDKIQESNEKPVKVKKKKRKREIPRQTDNSELFSSSNGEKKKGRLSKAKSKHQNADADLSNYKQVKEVEQLEVEGRQEEKNELSSKEKKKSSSSSTVNDEEEGQKGMSSSKDGQGNDDDVGDEAMSSDKDGQGSTDDEDEDLDEEDEEVGFTIIGEVEEKSKKKVRRVLPEWLSQPTIVEHDLTHNQVSVADYPLITTKIAAALKQNNITHLFPVQRHVIPIILDSVKYGLHAGNVGYRPRDLCVSAPTGSGKTLAFAVPIVQALHDRVVPRIRALTVLPTRDLANQVYRVYAMLCNAVNLRAVLLGGQKSFDKEQEMLTKHSHSDGMQVDIVVATPGRLVDHINNTKGFTLEHLRFLEKQTAIFRAIQDFTEESVIDEADRMMEQISKDWISQVERSAYAGKSALFGIASIMQARPKPGPVTIASCVQIHQPLQKLLFSATLSQNPEKLTHLNLFQPRLVTTLVTQGQQRRSRGQQEVTDEEREEKGEFVGKYTTPVGLTEFYIQCGKGYKPLVVLHLMKRLHCRQVLCFTNTVEATHRLYLLVKIVGGVNVAEFSSNLKTAERQQILKQFKAEKIDLLICSDAMARGMDIDNVRFVISYGLPPYLKTYIHRVGRTARAGKPGIAFSLLQKSEVPMFKSMLKNAGKTDIEKHAVRPGDLHPLMMDYEDALDQLPDVLKKEKEKS